MSSLPDHRSSAASDDFVAQLAGLAPDGATAVLRAFRADATRYTQGSHDALFSKDVTDLALQERLIAAWYAALLSRADQSAQAYRERLLALETADSAATQALLDAIMEHRELPFETIADKRLAAILAHTEALVLRPAATGQAALSTLQTAGLTTRAIVALAQLVAFVTYQVRVVAALRALEAKA
ncbi:CMD domain-containing protein [Paraburkholderia sediminicola]|uniref:CMD domain-containing protein n=1 Tax=Paraburkholderia sediminicola TaxID=458836 RepID=UPI0038B98CCC